MLFGFGVIDRGVLKVGFLAVALPASSMAGPTASRNTAAAHMNLSTLVPMFIRIVYLDDLQVDHLLRAPAPDLWKHLLCEPFTQRLPHVPLSLKMRTARVPQAQWSFWKRAEHV